MKYQILSAVFIFLMIIFVIVIPLPSANAKFVKTPLSQQTKGNSQVMNFKNGLFFRWNSRKITVRYDMNITNTGNKTVNITTYIAQPDTHINQEIHGPINYYPNPNGFLTDRWGQKVAYYTYTLQPNHNMTLSWQANATVYSVRFIILPWKIKGAIPEDIKENFTSDEPMYKINDPFIQGIVNNVTGKIRNILLKVIKLHNYVINNLEYVHDDRWDDAVTVLKQGHGSCSEYCYAFIALCRAAGIPARYNGGSLYKKEPPHIDRMYHRIVEIYLPSYEWVPIDVTWDDISFKYFYFGHHLNKLFTLAIGGGASEYLNWSYHYWQEVTPPSNDIIVNKSITWLRWVWGRF